VGRDLEMPQAASYQQKLFSTVCAKLSSRQHHHSNVVSTAHLDVILFVNKCEYQLQAP
jgi:hypothetical protein